MLVLLLFKIHEIHVFQDGLGWSKTILRHILAVYPYIQGIVGIVVRGNDIVLTVFTFKIGSLNDFLPYFAFQHTFAFLGSSPIQHLAPVHNGQLMAQLTYIIYDMG